MKNEVKNGPLESKMSKKDCKMRFFSGKTQKEIKNEDFFTKWGHGSILHPLFGSFFTSFLGTLFKKGTKMKPKMSQKVSKKGYCP
jgi:hypothetical protein